MFGAKGPNSSQYDFKGTTVYLIKYSSNHLPAHTSLLRLVQAELLVAMQEQLADHNQTKAEGFQINCKIKPINSKAPDTKNF
jgi:hypothetical protein